MRKTRVLIVDDSVTIRAMLEQVLSNDRRFQVAGIALSAMEAKEMMRRTPHDIVTLDLAMPGIGGLEFLDELGARHHAPVVVVSSSTTEGSAAAAEAIEHGAVACFDKARIFSNLSGFLDVLQKAVASNGK